MSREHLIWRLISRTHLEDDDEISQLISHYSGRSRGELIYQLIHLEDDDANEVSIVDDLIIFEDEDEGEEEGEEEDEDEDEGEEEGEEEDSGFEDNDEEEEEDLIFL